MRHPQVLPKSPLLKSFIKKFIQFYSNQFQKKYHELDEFGCELLALGLFFRIYQVRYFIKDYLIKKPYKVIRCETEFGPELKWYVPFAYWHYKNGTLLRTESVQQTACFYPFSPNHVEVKKNRTYIINHEVPNAEDHNFYYSKKKWLPPSFADLNSKKLNIDFNRPILIISNKYTTEWDCPPINFLSVETILKLCDCLHQKYQIIYNRPSEKLIVPDNFSSILDLNEVPSILATYPDVIFAEQLYLHHTDKFKNYNEFQVALYSKCKNFISVQGGNSVLASYFGGKNLIYAKEGREIFLDEFKSFYPTLSGAKISVAATIEQLLANAEQLFG